MPPRRGPSSPGSDNALLGGCWSQSTRRAGECRGCAPSWEARPRLAPWASDPSPASLEPAAYGLLRSLGFAGVAITDAVGMEAIVEQWSLQEATVLALNAGADLVLATPGDKAAAMRDGVVAAVADGRLPETRL